MSQTFKSYLGIGENPLEMDMSTVRALPASWFSSQEMYELERRAIFSKKWLLTTHQLRLPNTGDWVRFEVGGFDYVVCKDRTGSINAFHNVCRHRAFPIVTTDKGNSLIFACKYHGWSYGLNGKLAKAPGYQDLPGFDKNQNNLFPIHVHIDQKGFIWVNMEAQKPEIAWEDEFAQVDEQSRFKEYNWDDYAFDHAWEKEGDYNWKIAADNYNDRYHRKVADSEGATVEPYEVQTQAGHIQHFSKTTPDVASTFYLPNSSTNVTPSAFVLHKIIPTSPTKIKTVIEVYRAKSSSDADFAAVKESYERLAAEDEELCTSAQKNLNVGVFVNGEMHPQLEKGPLYFEQSVREALRKHYEREVVEGLEIWPAKQTIPKSAGATKTQNDDNFCSAVNCCRLNKTPAGLTV